MNKLLIVILTAWIATTAPLNGLAQTDIGECTVESYSEDSLYQFNGHHYRKLDFPLSLQQALYDAQLQYYKAQKAIIDQAILLKEVKRIAKETHRTDAEVTVELFSVEPPTDDLVKAFYERNKGRITASLEAVEDQIIQALMQQKAQQRQTELLEELKQKNGFELSIPKPVAPYVELAVEGFPRKGADNASVTIVEFADYQCPHCKTAASALSEMLKRYPDDLSIIYVDFPVNRSGISRIVAEGAACANEQGKFWEYHDRAFADQDILSKDSPIQLAEALALDMELFEACMVSTLPKEHVSQGENEAIRFGLSGTPTLFLNGRRLHLHDILTELPVEIDAILDSKG